MKTSLVALFIIFALQFAKAQFGCSPSTLPDEIFPPNSVTTSTNTLFIQYLCGPNTVLYDTTVSFCHRVYVENNCTLVFRPKCIATDHIWLKSNSTLNIMNYFGDIAIHVEIGAIINQSTSPMYSCSIDTCSTIIFPNINCTTGLIEYDGDIKVNVFPNPTNSILNINDEKNQFQNATIEIKNYLGQVVFTSPFKTQIDLQNFSSGMYFLTIDDKEYKRAIKIVKSN